MYNQSEPAIDPPEDEAQFWDARNATLLDRDTQLQWEKDHPIAVKLRGEQDATLAIIRAQKKMWDALDAAVFGVTGHPKEATNK